MKRNTCIKFEQHYENIPMQKAKSFEKIKIENFSHGKMFWSKYKKNSTLLKW